MPEISNRSKKALEPLLSYEPQFLKALNDMYDAKTNPEGYLCFVVAENKVSFNLLLKDKVIELARTLNEQDLANDRFPPFYSDFRGYPPFKEELSKYYSKYFLSKKFDYVFKPDSFVASSGVSSLLESLGSILWDQGDTLIIPAPYYPAFDTDLVIRSNVSIIQAHLMSPDFKLTEDVLQEALDKAESKVKGLLITNPGNPLGTCYSRDELKLALDFARKNNLFLISDEIYACSVYGKDKFISIAEVCLEESTEIGQDVIILYGFSKDFCMSGARVGILYTENEQILTVYESYGLFNSVSCFTQIILTKLLSEEKFIEDYLNKSKDILLRYSNKVKALLEELNIPYIDSTASLFLVADFTGAIKAQYKLKEISFDDERNFFQEFANEEKVVLTPGRDCRFARPGYFRLCYAFSDETAIDVLKIRLTNFLKS